MKKRRIKEPESVKVAKQLASEGKKDRPSSKGEKVTSASLLLRMSALSESTWEEALKDAQVGARKGILHAGLLFKKLFRMGKGVEEGTLLAEELILSGEMREVTLAYQIFQGAFSSRYGAKVGARAAEALLKKEGKQFIEQGLKLLTRLVENHLAPENVANLGAGVDSPHREVILAQLELFIELVLKGHPAVYSVGLDLAEKRIGDRDLGIRESGFLLAGALADQGYRLNKLEGIAVPLLKSAIWQDRLNGVRLLSRITRGGGILGAEAMNFFNLGVKDSSLQVREETLSFFRAILDQEFAQEGFFRQGLQAAAKGLQEFETALLSIEFYCRSLKEGKGVEEAREAVASFQKLYPKEKEKIQPLLEALSVLK